MASIVVGTLRVLLTSDSAQFEAGMRRAQQSFGAWSKSAQSIGRQATQLGASLTKTLTLPILGFGGAVAKAAIDFESSFAGVKKTVNATEAEFAVMAQSLRDLAKTIPVNVNELNRLAEAAGAMGIPKAEIVEFSRVMALLGVTTNVTSDQAAESIGKIQNIFASAGKETDRFAATLVALGNNGASTESQILEMATRIAGAGNVIGLTQGQVLGFASALSSVGLEAEAGGTAISRVFVDIASSVSKGGKELAQFANVAGLSTAAFSKMFKEDAAGAVLAFIEGLGRIKASGGDVLGVLAAMGIEEVRLRDALLRASGAGDILRQSLVLQAKAWQENSALTEEARKRFETTSSQLTLLWNRVKDVAITLGNALLPMIKATVSVLDDLLPIIESVARMFVALPTPIQAVVVGFGLVLAAAPPLLWFFGQLAIAGAALAKAFAAGGIAARGLAVAHGVLAVSVRVLASSFGLLGLAIGAVWAAWKIGNTETVKNSIATWALSADNLTAKLFRLVAGVDKMSEAEARAAVQATASAGKTAQAGVAADKHAQGLMASHGAMKAVTSALKAGEPALDMNLFKTKESEKALSKQAAAALRAAEAFKDLIGEQARIDASALAKALGGSIGVSNMSAEAQRKIGTALGEGIDAWRALGMAVPASVQKQFDAVQQLRLIPDALALVRDATRDTAAAWSANFVTTARAQAEQSADAMLASFNRGTAANRDAAITARDIDMQRAEFAIRMAELTGATWQDVYAMDMALSKRRLDAVISDEQEAFRQRVLFIDRTTEIGRAEYDALAKAHNLTVQQMTEAWRQGEAVKREEIRRTHSVWVKMVESLKQAWGTLEDAITGRLGSLFFGNLGHDVTGELKAAADEAELDFLRIKRNGQATAEELSVAFNRWREAEDRANFSFGERWKQFWGGLKQTFVSILDDMLGAYIKILARMAAVKFGANLTAGSVLGSVLGGGAAAATGGAAAGGAAAAGAAGATAASGAGGAGATAAGVGGGIGLGTTVALTGGVAAGVLLAWAIWKQGLFRGGEERFVNKRRDKFQLQLGGPPVSVGGSVMAGTLASWGKGPLFDAMQRANKMRTYDAAQSGIVESFAAHGQQLKSFALGGFVPPGVTVPAMLHGGTHGEVVMPADKMGSRVVNIYNTIQGVLDRDSVEAVWREHIIPMEKRALILNTDDITLFHRKVLV